MTKIKAHPLILFFILAFLLPWLVWGTTIAQTRGILSFHIPQSLAFWVGLTLATFLSAAITGGIPAIKDLFYRMIRWRVNPIWYIAALTLTGILGVVSIGIHLVFGGTHQVGVLLPLSNLLPSLLFQIFFFWLTEETAWRGFALPRLQSKYNPTISSLILGLLWGLWHIPLFFIPGSFQSTIPFTGFILSAVAISILMTWVFNHTKGSVLVAAVFHAATDVTIAFTNVMSGDLRLFWIFIIVQWAAAIGTIFIHDPIRLSRVTDLRQVIYAPENR
jgi:membrane protease YdiL (CAAX protease family)